MTMFPIEDFARRYGELLSDLDAFSEEAELSADDAEALDDLNAELEDAILLLSQIRADGDDWRDELSDALEEIEALAADYRALSARAPGLDALAGRLEMAVRLAADNLRG